MTTRQHYLPLLATAMLLASCGAKSTTDDTSTQMSRISIEGNHFVNAEGDSIVFRGLCCSDPLKLVADSMWNERYFDEIADWGANIVRFAIHPSWLNQMGWEKAFELYDQGVKWASERQMYVILDWHSIGNLRDAHFTNDMYNTTLDETIRFWQTAAQRYKDEPTVALYEIFNEPTCQQPGLGEMSWNEWRQVQEQIIDSIRVIQPEAICLCAGFNWAYDLTPVGADPIQRPSIAYVCHPYPMKRMENWEENWQNDFGYLSANYPVVCTELGYCHEDDHGSHIPVIWGDDYGPAITNFLDQRGISFTVWCFDPHWAPTLIDDWNFTLSTQGRYFKPYMQGQQQTEGTEAETEASAN